MALYAPVQDSTWNVLFCIVSFDNEKAEEYNDAINEKTL